MYYNLCSLWRILYIVSNILLVPRVLQRTTLFTRHFAQMWKSEFVGNFPRGEIVGSKGSNFDRFCQLALYKSCTNVMLPQSMRVSTSDGEHLTTETTHSRYPRFCPLLRNAIQWTPFSDLCFEGQVTVRETTHHRPCTCILTGVLETSGVWQGGGWKMPSTGVFFPIRQKKRCTNWMVLWDSTTDPWKDFPSSRRASQAFLLHTQIQSVQHLMGPTQKVLACNQAPITSFEVGLLDYFFSSHLKQFWNRDSSQNHCKEYMFHVLQWCDFHLSETDG